ncbi:peptidyl-prolyl cis-trans isomerase [Phyllobacterium sp. 0TCS1.6C]|uniref:peptidyl-prolyl cis-trans isomerase n=1 Tax=unclassified Phyllobacterium TaxID=2638441 RepID=UPI00226419F5|nr:MULTISPECIES: peptidyl-prolyl cis-trans isomerase [unclassified Phyllobacterium]MCX8280669.1 peptidyl-prolyl cis-trans isomerase [Phyllobacterium sp. 0TCS1.6C]MCX8292754.1 peptidyl-prolyl cis-trans isomerase [Phyllobacterium sp. 0TCS1.6A]
MLDSLRNVARTWVVKVMMGLLVVSFAGWGVSSTVLGTMGGSSAMQAGQSTVSAVDYRLAYDRQLAMLSQQVGQRLSREQAEAVGLTQRVQGQLVAGVVLDEQARQMSLGLSKDRLAMLAAEDPAFRGANGQFSQQQFDIVLRNAGMTPQAYLDNREQVARRQQIIEAVADGIKAPDTLLKAMALYKGESRTIEYVSMPKSFISNVADPSDADLKTYFEAHKETYGAPQYRKVSYVKLEPKDIADPASITPEEIKAEYDRDIGRFSTPEMRKIDQLTFANEEAAKAAREKIAAGTSFDDIVKQENKTADDVRLGSFPKNGLPDESLADAIFALPANGVSDVLKGTFGPVIIRVAEMTPGHTKPLAEVEADIRESLAQAQAVNSITDVHDAYENARADGLSMAEAAAKANLKMVTIDAVDATGQGLDEKPVANLPFNEAQLAAVFQADVGFDNEPLSLGSNSYLWYDVDSVIPARERPLEEVKDRVIANWKIAEQEKQLNQKAEEVRKRVAEGTTLDAIAGEFKFTKETKRGITRGSQDTDLGLGGVDSVFDGPQGLVGLTESASDGSKLIFKVTEVIEPANTGPETLSTAERDSSGNRLADDLLDQLVAQLQTVYPVTVNPTVINQALSR